MVGEGSDVDRPGPVGPLAREEVHQGVLFLFGDGHWVNFDHSTISHEDVSVEAWRGTSGWQNMTGAASF